MDSDLIISHALVYDLMTLNKSLVMADDGLSLLCFLPAALQTAVAELPLGSDLDSTLHAQDLLAGCQGAGPAAMPWVAALALLLGDVDPLLGVPPLPVCHTNPHF